MTIEQKAKTYDEALKWMRSLYPTMTGIDKEDAEHYFPELRESEDERIRGAIIDHLKDNNLTEWAAWLEKQGKKETLCDKCRKEHPSHSCQDITALGRCALEKQDEQKVSVVDFKAKDWYVSKVDGKIYNAKFMEKTPTNQARKLEIEKAAMSTTGIIEQEEWFIKGAEWSDKNPSYICSEKQNEQKPTDKVEPKFKVKYAGSEYNVFETKDIAGVTFYEIEDEPNHIDYVKAENCDIISGYAIKENGSPYPTKPAVFSEQKPTDEEMKELLRTEYEKGRADAIAETQVAWSEEDEKEVAILEAYIRSKDWSERHIDRALSIVNELVNKVKSIRLQKQWKPSKEQIDALDSTLQYSQVSYNSLEHLNSLYNDLMKLKEE